MHCAWTLLVSIGEEKMSGNSEFNWKQHSRTNATQQLRQSRLPNAQPLQKERNASERQMFGVLYNSVNALCYYCALFSARRDGLLFFEGVPFNILDLILRIFWNFFAAEAIFHASVRWKSKQK